MGEPITTVLGGIVVALVSGMAGAGMVNMKSVKKPFCDQIRASCKDLLIEKIDNLEKKVDALTKAVNNKLFGL